MGIRPGPPMARFLAISLLGSIWKVDATTGDAVQLTYDRTYHSSPDWSPDGKWLIYTSDDDNRRIQLAILNVASGSRTLTDDNHVYLDPVFSPDGGRVAYVSTQPNGHFNLYIRPIRDGTWSGPAIPVSSDRRYRNGRLYFGAWDLHTEPAWTRDGKALMVLSNRDVPLGSGNLWRVPAVEGGMSQAVSSSRPSKALFRARPDVSPDGKRFVYASTSGAADQFNHLYVLPVDGGAPYKLTFGDHDDFHPRWSPDGEHIAYISNEGGLPKLVVMETYGGGKRTVAIQPKSWKTSMHQVRVSVVDEQGRPAAARVHAVASDAKFYAPLDAYSRVTVSGQHFFHTDGDSVIWAPAGPLKLTALQGFEFWPARSEIVVGGETNCREADASPVCRFRSSGLAQRLHARPYELRRKFPEYAGKSDVHVTRRRTGRRQRIGRQQGQPHSRLDVLRAGRG